MLELIESIGWSTIINAVLVIIIAVFGTKYANIKHKFGQVVELAKTLNNSLEDNKLTEEEIKDIKDAWNNILDK